MGLFSKKVNYPELSEEHPATEQIESIKVALEELVGQVSEPLEVVPADNHGYVFIGKPPKKFGVAWVKKDGKVVNFRSLVEEKGLSVVSLEQLSDRLKEIYIKHQEEPRYSLAINDRQIVVTPSETLKSDIRKVIEETIS